MPGTLAGNLIIALGTTQVTSPLSLDDADCGRCPSAVGLPLSPIGFAPMAVWNLRAKACSSSLQRGMPTASMLAWIASATGLRPSWGQAAASIWYSHVVPVISAAPSAILTS
jgi:hypothetical protein